MLMGFFLKQHIFIILGGVKSVYLSNTIRRIPLYFTPLYQSFFPPYYLIGNFPFFVTYSSCWGWYCPFHSARTYTVKTTPKCRSLEFVDSRTTAPQRKEQTEHSCLVPRLSNHWPLLLWHPISDTTMLRTIRAAIQPDLLAIESLGHLHPASGIFFLQEAEFNCPASWDTYCHLTHILFISQFCSPLGLMYINCFSLLFSSHIFHLASKRNTIFLSHESELLLGCQCFGSFTYFTDVVVTSCALQALQLTWFYFCYASSSLDSHLNNWALPSSFLLHLESVKLCLQWSSFLRVW